MLPYNQQQLEFLGVEPLAVSHMHNMTNNRLHSNGERVLYPTFVNIGRQRELRGESVELFRLRFRAKTALPSLKWQSSGMMVDRSLRTLSISPL